MPRYTKKDKDGRYYIESVNGKLESNIFGHTYGEAIDRFAELENADVTPRSEVKKIFSEILTLCDNAEDKLDKLFTKANDYRKGYENSVKHFKKNMLELKEKYTKGGEG